MNVFRYHRRLVSVPTKSRPRTATRSVFLAELLENRCLLSAVPTFGTASLLPTGLNPSEVVVGDFNGDGKADLAVTINGGPVEVVLGNGDGTFQSPVDYSVEYNGAPGALAVAVGDFYGDGKEDLVVIPGGGTDAGVVGILRGNGDGTFQAMVTANVGSVATAAATDLAVGDFRGDGIDDLVFAQQNNVVCVELGNGDGTFQSPVNYQLLDFAQQTVAVGDFYDDGKMDIAASAYYYTGTAVTDTLSILRGNGDGTFQSPVLIPTKATLFGHSLVVGDFTGDGQSDLAFESLPSIANASSGNCTVSILLGNGNGTFQSELDYPTSVPESFPFWLAAGDLTGRGQSDLVVGGATGTSLSIELNTTGGNVAVASPGAQSAASGVNKTIDLGNATLSNLNGPIMLDVNWGDGSAASQITVTPAAMSAAVSPALAGDVVSGAIPLSASHAFANSGNDAVTVSIDSAFTNDAVQVAHFTVAVAGQQPVYRLYSPATQEHLFTSDVNECSTLTANGWTYEEIACDWYSAPATVDGVTDEPLYRLYDPAIQQHLWTTDLNEYVTLATRGWTQEGIAGYVFPTAVAGSEPLYRLNDPATAANADLHLWTTDLNEYNTLAGDGWTAEGVIGYVM